MMEGCLNEKGGESTNRVSVLTLPQHLSQDLNFYSLSSLLYKMES